MKKRKRVLSLFLSLALCAAVSCSLLPAPARAAETEGASSWQELQEMIDEAGENEVIALAGDITAGSDDAALTVPADKTITLDLDGHTLSRGRLNQNPVKNGSVLIVDGKLTITGNGVITGGNTDGNGGGILVNGSVVLESGAVKGNHALGGKGGDEDDDNGRGRSGDKNGKGGGVYIGKGSFVMTGGSVTGNSSVGNGAGVCLDAEPEISCRLPLA